MQWDVVDACYQSVVGSVCNHVFISSLSYAHDLMFPPIILLNCWLRKLPTTLTGAAAVIKSPLIANTANGDWIIFCKELLMTVEQQIWQRKQSSAQLGSLTAPDTGDTGADTELGWWETMVSITDHWSQSWTIRLLMVHRSQLSDQLLQSTIFIIITSDHNEISDIIRVDSDEPRAGKLW